MEARGGYRIFPGGGAEFHASGKNLGEYAGEKLSAPPLAQIFFYKINFNVIFIYFYLFKRVFSLFR